MRPGHLKAKCRLGRSAVKCGLDVDMAVGRDGGAANVSVSKLWRVLL